MQQTLLIKLCSMPREVYGMLEPPDYIQPPASWLVAL